MTGREKFLAEIAEHEAAGGKGRRKVVWYWVAIQSPEGVPMCVWCGAEMPGRRKTTHWCGDGCVTEYKLLRGDPTTIRREVEKRDRSVCAECGANCTEAAKRIDLFAFRLDAGSYMSWDDFEREIRHAIVWADSGRSAALSRLLGSGKPEWDRLAGPDSAAFREPLRARLAYRELVSRYGLARHRTTSAYIRDPRRATLWDADHIRPVSAGSGVGCGLDNFQTLCVVCHRKKSTAQRKIKA